MDSEDEDDEDYVPKKKQKPTDKQHVEKQRIRSPDIHQVRSRNVYQSVFLATFLTKRPKSDLIPPAPSI